MKISRPNNKELSAAEIKELEKLKVLIDRVTSDGIVTNEEMQAIKIAISSDKKVSVEELKLVRKLIDEKIASGELKKDWQEV